MTEVIENSIDRTDIVIPYVISTVVWDELKYALRSIHANARFDYKLFLVANQLPAWASDKVHLIETTQVKGMPFAKAYDSYRKLRAIIDDPRVSDEFLYTYDDTIFATPVYKTTLRTLRRSHAEIKSEEYIRRDFPDAGANWKTMLANTFKMLKAKGLPCFNYETHMPRLFSKEKMLEVMEVFGLKEGNPAIVATLYYNYHFRTAPKLLTRDDKLKGEIRQPLDMKDIRQLLDAKLFVNYNDRALNEDFKTVIGNRFKDKVPFED